MKIVITKHFNSRSQTRSLPNRLFLRKGPNLTIIMDSDVRFAAENPVIFSAQFSILPAQLASERHRGFSPSPSSECPLECAVRNERRSCKLSSPGYPGVYPRGIKCRIGLESGAGRFKIGGQPDDTYDLMNRTWQEGCQTENCEDHVEGMVAELRRARVEPGDAGRRGKRSPEDREEEVEFIIGQTSYRGGRNGRRRLKKGRKDAGSEDIRRGNIGRAKGVEGGGESLAGYRGGQGIRWRGEKGGRKKRVRHPQRVVRKKSMDSIRRNISPDTGDISDARIRSDGMGGQAEIARKGSSKEKINALQVSLSFFFEIILTVIFLMVMRYL